MALFNKMFVFETIETSVSVISDRKKNRLVVWMAFDDAKTIMTEHFHQQLERNIIAPGRRGSGTYKNFVQLTKMTTVDELRTIKLDDELKLGNTVMFKTDRDLAYLYKGKGFQILYRIETTISVPTPKEIKKRAHAIVRNTIASFMSRIPIPSQHPSQ